MLKRPIILLLCTAFLLSGCVTFHNKPLLPDKTAAAFESRTLTDSGLKTYLETNLRHSLPDWPFHQWDLDELTLAAFYYHPDLDVARAQWAAARGGEKTAAERPNPTLNLS